MNKERVITFFITTPKVGVMFIIMMQERSLAALRSSRIMFSLSRSGSIRRKLMVTVMAKISLETKIVFAETIEVKRIVAFRTLNMIYFLH